MMLLLYFFFSRFVQFLVFFYRVLLSTVIAVNVIFAQNQGILYSFYALALRAYFLFLSHRNSVLVFSSYRSVTFLQI